MEFVIGREAGQPALPAAMLGQYRALDGSSGAAIGLDVDSPHAILVVGKRGYGKSYTLGVIAEDLARTPGVAPTVVDPMGVFGGLGRESTGDQVPATIIERPSVTPDVLDPRSWCELLGLSPESGAGSLLWQAAQQESSLAAMQRSLTESGAPQKDVRAAVNHLRLAQSWDVFDDDGMDAERLGGSGVTVLSLSHLDPAPMNAVCRGVTETLYRARATDRIDRLPWLLLDEAHAFFHGVACTALRRVLTRGRAPGVSMVAATQRPSAVPAVCISQSDVVISHRLTAREDVQALEQANPTYLSGSITERLPTAVGEVAIVDDTTETVQSAKIRTRDTPHDGDSPSASR